MISGSIRSNWHLNANLKSQCNLVARGSGGGKPPELPLLLQVRCATTAGPDHPFPHPISRGRIRPRKNAGTRRRAPATTTFKNGAL